MNLLWFDTEFSDLHLEKAALLQVAVLATDGEGNLLCENDAGLNLLVRPVEGALISPWVQENLASLLERCASDEALETEEVDRRLSAYVQERCGQTPVDLKERPNLAGNTVHMDLWVARRFLPAFSDCLHYRLLDVSTLKLIWQDQVDPDPVDKESKAFILEYGVADELAGTAHDAFYDIHASIAEYRFYRKHFLRT